MSETLSVIIRDGLARDIPNCLLLDHSYETEYVWQMQIASDDGWRIDFKTERLPRTLEIDYPASEDRLRAAAHVAQCFLVATTRDDEPEIIGYLTMRGDHLYGIGFVHDIVVSRPYRRHQIALRLTKAATMWAREHELSRITVETQTKNYPGIRFCEAAGFAFCGFNDRYFPNRDIAVFFSQSVR
ncbi:MAG: GNAT family N-acetyltransferase [Anaerolineae bacterium]